MIIERPPLDPNPIDAARRKYARECSRNHSKNASNLSIILDEL